MGIFRRLANNQDGTTAVELAFVIRPFCLLLAAIFELGLTLTAQSLRTARRAMRPAHPHGTSPNPGQPYRHLPDPALFEDELDNVRRGM